MKARAVLGKALAELLLEGHAHVTVEKAVRGLDPALRGRRPSPRLHSVWEELEHMRLAQEDILRYTLDASWQSPPWPEGYWPKPGPPDDKTWARSLRRFKADRKALAALAQDPARNLTAKIPHGEGRTYLRQILLVADHNAYHLGQIVAARKLLGAWRS
jgi:uncharacterized damage-inducible protein DinB